MTHSDSRCGVTSKAIELLLPLVRSQLVIDTDKIFLYGNGCTLCAVHRSNRTFAFVNLTCLILEVPQANFDNNIAALSILNV